MRYLKVSEVLNDENLISVSIRIDFIQSDG